MKVLTIILFLFGACSFGQVFPEAKGFGASWTFPSTYDVYVVNDLGNSGIGTLRDAITTAPTNGNGRIIVFNGISGQIALSSSISMSASSRIYIAGQTSTNGILLSMSTSVEQAILTGGTAGLIVRGITFAVGAGQLTAETTPHVGLPTPSAGSGDGSGNVNGDNVTLSSGSNAIFDHCTFIWSTDESINPYGTDNITFQNCIIGWSLMYATHAYSNDSSDGSWYAPHSMGVLVGNGSSGVTFYNCVFANNNQRNPLIQPPSGGSGQYELVNNVLYNMGQFGMHIQSGGADVNFINNYAIAGPNTSSSRYPIVINPGIIAYSRGNISWKRPLSTNDEWDAIGCESCGTYMQSPAPTAWQSLTAFSYPLSSQVTLSSTTLLSNLTATGGSGTFTRNSAEVLLISGVTGGTGQLIDYPSDVGGYPTITSTPAISDSDNDGIPDDQEGTYGSDTKSYVDDLASGLVGPGGPGTVSDPISALINATSAMLIAH